MFLIIINFAVEKHLNPLTFLNMSKKVFMISPFEALTGNLSGDQDLQYAENNNPAYEAPNGTQYARNYRTRYVGARRGKDGLVYFQVKQTTATVLTASTRRTMAIIGVTAAIRSALMSAHATDWSKINQAFDYIKAQGQLPEGQDTFNKWFSAQIKNMLVYKRATWSFSQASISFTIHNPYDIASADALVIKKSIWVKFANFFAFNGTAQGGIFYTIDGMKLFAPYDLIEGVQGVPAFEDLVPGSVSNPNYKAIAADLALNGTGKLTYKSMPVYDTSGAEVTGFSKPTADAKYTTVDPNI